MATKAKAGQEAATEIRDPESGLAEIGHPATQDGEVTDTTPAADALLLLSADFLDDIEKLRIACANRLRALTQQKGLGDIEEARRWEGQLDQLHDLEKFATKELQKSMKAHPLSEFVKNTIGLGEKQTARFLATVGDLAERPNPSKVWAYCGLHVVDGKAPKRRRGVQANWNPTARMRAYLLAESCIKQMRSPYRKVYDREREKWKDRETSDGHKHNHAMRVVSKAIVLDLWREARDKAGLPHHKNRVTD